MKVSRYVSDMRQAYSQSLNIKPVREASGTRGLRFLDNDSGSEAVPEAWIKETISPREVPQRNPRTAYDPQDVCDGEPHEACPAHFGGIVDVNIVCNDCDVEEQCRRMTTAWK